MHHHSIRNETWTPSAIEKSINIYRYYIYYYAIIGYLYIEIIKDNSFGLLSILGQNSGWVLCSIVRQSNPDSLTMRARFVLCRWAWLWQSISLSAQTATFCYRRKHKGELNHILECSLLEAQVQLNERVE